MRGTFSNQLKAAWKKSGSLLCVGLDPAPGRFPAGFAGTPDGIYAFCKEIIDATHDTVCAFKPQIAYFHAASAEGALERLIAYIHTRYPGIPVILDAKRGDIGSTAEQYAKEAFERYDADAVTLNPYMGTDTITPYLSYEDRGVIVLARTSNPGGSDFQLMNVRTPAGEMALYEHVTVTARDKWNVTGQCGLVVGATRPAELKRVREIVPDMPLLVPGIGAQGGDIEAVVKAGASADGTGMIINSSRAILYAGTKTGDFAAASRAAAIKTRDEINRFR